MDSPLACKFQTEISPKKDFVSTQDWMHAVLGTYCACSLQKLQERYASGNVIRL